VIKIDRKFVDAIRASQSGPDLWIHLQNAIKLEHSTIPPYITAMFSLKPGTNQSISNLIRSIVIQEMQHMTIASNILIAIGGKPEINTNNFIPAYPGPLPMNVGDLRVGIEGFSIPLVKNVFKIIEEPEHEIPVTTGLVTEAEQFATIGQFYDAVKDQITNLGPDIFVQKQAPPQVLASAYFPPNVLFPITSPSDANRAIDIIKTQGEGTSSNPFDTPGEPAHFYRFGEIAAGKTLIKTATGFSYGGDPIPFDSSGVFLLRPNCKIADYQADTQARTRITQFAYSYSSLLNALHAAFNGQPDKLDAAVGLMYDLRTSAASLMDTPDPTAPGLNVGPSFEYV
jgi:ferritin-like protein